MIRVRLLGSIEIRDSADKAVTGMALQPKRAALLAYLAASPDRAHSRETVMALFWPELDQVRARRALNQAVHHLREQLGDDVVRTSGRDQLVFAEDAAWCDLIEFQRACADNRAGAALACYRGDLLEGFHVSELPELERWIDETRMRLRGEASRISWAAADEALSRGDRDEAARLATAARDLAPEFDESAMRRLMQLFDRCGNRAGALREYDAFVARVESELGAAPDAETAALAHRLRSSQGQGDRPTAAGEHHIVSSGAPVQPEAPFSARPARPNSRATIRLAASLLGLLGVSGAAWLALRPDTVPAGGVAVFPLSYSGTPEMAHLSTALADLVAANIADLEGLYSIDSRAVATAAGGNAPSRRVAHKVARQLGARFVVTGTIAAAAGKLRVTVTLSDVGVFGPPSRASAEGASDELFTIADRIATQLVAERAGGRSVTPLGSAARLTNSPAALRAWSEGESAYRAGRFSAAVAAFLRAVEADSTFAAAWLRVSNAAHWTGEGALAARAAQNALRLSNRLGPRARQHVTAWNHFVRGDVEAAAPIYHAILAQDSADAEAWVQLGEIAFHWGPSVGRPTPASRELWERALRLAPFHVEALVHIARIEAREERKEEFDRLVSRIRSLEPASDVMRDLTVIRAFAFGTPEDRLRATEIVAESPGAAHGDIIRLAVWSAADLGEARSLLGPLIHQAGLYSNRQAGDYAFTAGMDLARGRIRSATVAIDSGLYLEPNRMADYLAAVATVPVVGWKNGVAAAKPLVRAEPKGRGAEHPLAELWRLYARGIVAVHVGDTAMAAECERRLKRIAAENAVAGDGRLKPMALHNARVLAAARLRERGEATAALAALGEPSAAPTGRPGIWGTVRAHERMLRGELLAALGRDEDALSWFRTFPDPTGYDLPFVPAALLRQLELESALGHTEQAKLTRAKLERLLADADEPMRVPPEQLIRGLRRIRGPITEPGNRR